MITAIISACSISIAVLATFLFQKYFAIRQERVQRKFLIDDYLVKISLLAEISHIVRNSMVLWDEIGLNKATLDNDYPDLTVHDFRNSKDQMMSLIEKFGAGELAPQAYIGLREIEQSCEAAEKEIYYPVLTNFSSSEIDQLNEISGYILTFFRENRSLISLNQKDKERIKKLARRINQKYDVDLFISVLLEDLFALFHDEIFDDSFFLTKQNETPLPWYLYLLGICLLLYTFTITASILLTE